MDQLLKWFFVLAPLVGQGIITIQQNSGVNHGTIIGTIAGWLLAVAVAGRGIVGSQAKNLSQGQETPGGGA